MIIDLTQLKPGKSGILIEIRGGRRVINKIHSLGLREGKEITKLSSHFWQGPQTVSLGNAQIAIGFGVAKKIMVEVKQ